MGEYNGLRNFKELQGSTISQIFSADVTRASVVRFYNLGTARLSRAFSRADLTQAVQNMH
jgi:hypothetical protein